jgi:hypothetical protein
VKDHAATEARHFFFAICPPEYYLFMGMNTNGAIALRGNNYSGKWQPRNY